MAAPKFTLTAPAFKTALAPFAQDLARASSAAMRETETDLKTDLRAQVEHAGMGARLARTWRGRVYPQGQDSIGAAAFVFSKAPEIVDAFDRGPTIRTVNGRKYLAIPTENVPRAPRAPGQRGGTKRMTPEQVELYFSQDLKFARTRRGRLFAFITVVASRGGRLGTPGKRATKQLSRYFAGGKTPRGAAQVVMFILTPTAKMPKRFDVEGAAKYRADQVPAILDRKVAGL